MAQRQVTTKKQYSSSSDVLECAYTLFTDPGEFQVKSREKKIKKIFFLQSTPSMRCIIQRVNSAQVAVSGNVISSIGKGLFVLIGISSDDTPNDSTWICKKVLGLRLFDDQDGNPWKKSVVDLGYEILFVSQFTLCANINKGTKPDYHGAMKSSESSSFYADFLNLARNQYQEEKIKDGEFGAYMQCSLTNDGPVTIQLDSKKL